MKTAIIPFSGFYNSTHDALLDDTLEQVFTDSSGRSNPELINRAFDSVNWGTVHRLYAIGYTEAWCDEFKVSASFESLQSPREYNFTTDRIFVNIEDAEISRILAIVPRALLGSVASEWFTSRSGFSSFYSPDVGDWGLVETWDHNLIGALLQAHTLHQNPDFDCWAEYELMESDRSNGQIDNWLFSDAGLMLYRCANVANYLRTREEKKYRIGV